MLRWHRSGRTACRLRRRGISPRVAPSGAVGLAAPSVRPEKRISITASRPSRGPTCSQPRRNWPTSASPSPGHPRSIPGSSSCAVTRSPPCCSYSSTSSSLAPTEGGPRQVRPAPGSEQITRLCPAVPTVCDVRGAAHSGYRVERETQCATVGIRTRYPSAPVSRLSRSAQRPRQSPGDRRSHRSRPPNNPRRRRGTVRGTACR
jgi:hypothetical protein